MDSRLIDLSNYDWDTFDAKAFYDAGVRRAIVGSQQPSLSGQMVEALRSEGIEVIAIYDLPYFGSDATTQGPIMRAVDFATQYSVPMVISDAEIDANQTNVTEWQSIPTPSVAQRQSEFRWGMNLIRRNMPQHGVYTNAAWWNPNMGASIEWADSKLWLATYGVHGSAHEPISVVDFGGWETVWAHQYTSTYDINGRGRDMSYLFEEVTQEDEVTQDDFDKMLAASAPFQKMLQGLTALNQAVVQRFDIVAVASGTDAAGFAKVQAAHAALKEKGLVS
jgi:hypothetical protein